MGEDIKATTRDGRPGGTFIVSSAEIDTLEKLGAAAELYADEVKRPKMDVVSYAGAEMALHAAALDWWETVNGGRR